jgi:GT2 family glycosyltransferase
VSLPVPGAAPAVLVLACRRPEFTGRLLRFLVSAGVRDIHVVVDGAKDSSRDAELVARTREVVRGFDLPKDQLWLRDANLGGPKGVPEAIDWFFSARDRGIILEDDLLPDPSFIRFAAELLQVYENEPRVGAIHGWSSQLRTPPHSYYFSRYAPGWGWATWASRWKDFDREARLWFDVDHERVLRDIANGDASFVAYWMKVLQPVYAGGARNWDYRWLFTNFVLNRVTATASVNLVENTGFGEVATNTKSRLFFLLPTSTMQFPLRHPPEISADLRADCHTHRAVYLWHPWMRFRYRLAGA